MKQTILLVFFALSGILLTCARSGISEADPAPMPTVDSNRSPEELFASAKVFYDRKEYAKAAPLMIAAAERGNAEAQMHLGKMYFNGWGVPHDHEKGIEWHKKAAAQGNQESIQKLKKMEH